MRIAQIAPPFIRIPPIRYGGTERVVEALTEGLVKKGHDVTLFAAGTSKSPHRNKGYEFGCGAWLPGMMV